MAGKYATVNAAILFSDDATKAMQIACPVVDEIRGSLIVKDGVFATTVRDANGDSIGGVLGYAKFGWSEIAQKPLAKALTRATAIIGIGLQGPWVNRQPTIVEGFLVQLNAADTEAFGVDLIAMPNGMTGCLALTANALAFAFMGKEVENMNPVNENRATSAVTAIPLAEGLAALRAGSTVAVAGRPATSTQPALPAMVVPAFPAGKVVDAGHQPVAKAQVSLYAGLSKAVVVEDAQPETEIRNAYASRATSAFGSRRS